MSRIVTVKGRDIGGPVPLICAAVVGEVEENIMQEIKMVKDVKPDIVEWRADYFSYAEDSRALTAQLARIRGMLPDYPIIFTLRIQNEGGNRYIQQQTRLDAICAVADTGIADLIDIEMINGKDFISRVLGRAKPAGAGVILSYHNFYETPDAEEMVNTLLNSQNSGADIVKMAVMPKNPGDVLKLMNATHIFTSQYAAVPAITMSMGSLGVATRLCGGVLGSAVTFGALKEASAPGQIPVKQLRDIIRTVYR